MSAQEELALRELARQDLERELRHREGRAALERQERFRDRFPLLARLWYGKA